MALDPRDGAILAMASNPTFKPSRLRRARRSEEARSAPRREPPAARTTPASTGRSPGLYPPGSTWKPVTALAGMQDHVFSAYDSIRCSPVAYYGLDRQKFVNWNPYVDRPMTLVEALAESCDTYFDEIGNRFYERGSDGRVRLQQWARRFGFGGTTGLDIGGEAEGLVPTPEWRRKTFESDWDRAWNPGDSIQLAIGQKDLLVTPLQMAAFYGMLANGGNVLTPYLVSNVEQPGGKGSPRVVLRRFAPPPPQSARLDPVALGVVRDGLYAATHSQSGTSAGVFANYPIPISGKTGTAEKVTQLPGYPVRPPRGSVLVVRMGTVRGRPTRRLCADRERRPWLRGSRSGRAQGVREVLPREIRRDRRPDGDGLSARGCRTTQGDDPRRARDAATDRLRQALRLGAHGCRRCARRLRAVGRRRDHAVRRPRRREPLRDEAGRRRGPRRFRVPGGRIPAARPRAAVLEGAVRSDARPDDRRVRGCGDDPGLEALDRPRRHPVPALRARQSALRPRARRLRRGTRRPRHEVEDDPLDDRAGCDPHPARVHPAGPRDGARVRGGALRRSLLRRCSLAPARDAARSWPSSPCSRSSGGCRRWGSRC